MICCLLFRFQMLSSWFWVSLPYFRSLWIVKTFPSSYLVLLDHFYVALGFWILLSFFSSFRSFTTCEWHSHQPIFSRYLPHTWNDVTFLNYSRVNIIFYDFLSNKYVLSSVLYPTLFSLQIIRCFYDWMCSAFYLQNFFSCAGNQ